MRKDEKICPVCGKKFRLSKKDRIANKKYCSKTCASEGKKRNDKHFFSLGTNTHSLSPKAVKKQLYFIRNNIDKGYRSFNENKSQRDVYGENFVYNEDFSDIYLNMEED